MEERLNFTCRKFIVVYLHTLRWMVPKNYPINSDNASTLGNFSKHVASFSLNMAGLALSEIETSGPLGFFYKQRE